ncbi:MAG TPA: carboxypeptidase-like regulatory domain-containing protein [Bacteroidales bacterium]|nr:carboxypeptidase-like regulatory domain-containing protein [Bacteroidales bacterium]
MKNYIILFFLIYSSLGFCQSSYTISGFVRDTVTGEELIGVSIYDYQTNKTTLTNENGFYSILLEEGVHILEFSHVGYSITIDTITIFKHIHHNVFLQKSSIELNTIIVSATKYELSGLVKKMPLQQIEQTPTIFGVPDVIKVLQLQPGIKNIGDGASGMYVRGGNRDQNMIIIDDAPIYNISHMYGFVSAINPTMLKDATFYNSNIPAEFGGKISSVLDAKMKEGNMNANTGQFSFSPLTIDANIEGPIKKDTASYFFAIRKSVLDIFMNWSKQGFEVPLFYDINTKINYKINSKNRLFLSVYNGSDIFINENSKNTSNNITSTIRWLRIINPKLIVNTSYIYSKYGNNTIFQIDEKPTNWKTGITDNSIKSKISWFPNTNNTFSFGVNIQYHNCIPGNSGNPQTSISDMNLFENSIFAMHKIKINNSFSAHYGVRIQSYMNTGKGVWYSLNENYEPIKPNYESQFSWNSFLQN